LLLAINFVAKDRVLESRTHQTYLSIRTKQQRLF